MSSRKLVWTFPGGAIKSNGEALGAVSSKTFTVPSGFRWIVFGGYAERDQNATLKIEWFDENDIPLGKVPDHGAGTTNIHWGMSRIDNDALDASGYELPFPFVLAAGHYVKYTWGAAQTTPEVSLLILEIPE